MAPDTGPVVVIGLQQIYEAVVRLEGQMLTLTTQQTEAMKDLTDHETRIRSLERGRWPLPTASVLIALASLVLGLMVFLTR